MSTALAESTVTDPRLLRILESASVVEADGASAVADDGTVQIHLIRPCVGKGKGRHVYEAAMLRKHAESGHFVDWPMFIDHESPAARRAAGGLPRSLRDVGGRIVEHWWDDTVPAGGGFDKGAVVAKVLPVPYVQDLIRHDPKLVQASINTHATGVKPTKAGGRPAYIVEGFERDGSVDWVTKAGAGGKVVQLMEAAYETGVVDDDELRHLMEAMPDDRLADYVRTERPAVAETLTNAGHGEEDDVTPEELREAVQTELRSDDTKAIISEAVAGVVREQVSEALNETLPTAIGAAASVIESQATQAATKAVRMGALRSRAEEVVREAKLDDGTELPERFRAHVLEAVGTPDVEDTTDDDGKVTESAEAKFEAILEAELKAARELVEAARPQGTVKRRRTAVTENGSGSDPRESGHTIVETEEDEYDERPYRDSLQEAGVDVHAAWGVPRPDKAKATSKAEDGERETATA